MIIAIDGPAGAGKSTIAKLVAKALGYVYLDTGAMYRALTLKAIEQNISSNDISRIIELAKTSVIDLSNNADGSLTVRLDNRDVTNFIRQPRITKMVSDIAKIKEVREQMVMVQRRLGEQKDSVLDGRDIGTVVFPHAQKKFFLDALFSERVNRRFEELKQIGNQISREEVHQDLLNRDTIDSTRTVAPLKKADDAIYIDTTNMSIEEVVATLLKHIVSHG